MTGGCFVEVGSSVVKKAGQGAAGDSFLSRKAEDGRIIVVLSDGLGSGVKAGVLSALTATMAASFVAYDVPIQKAASTIMRTLPVCRERGISYSTFTIAVIDPVGRVQVMEYDNPPYALLRSGIQVEPIKSEIAVGRAPARGAPARDSAMSFSEFSARPGDRLVFFSDGVSQSGMGSRAAPLGWGVPAAQDFILAATGGEPEISARALAARVVKRAEANDMWSAKDDISCAVVYFREPRRLLIVTGPSIDPGRDASLGERFASFRGRKVICGGTTAQILARELGAQIRVSLKDYVPGFPPASTMEGADLVTEGILTLGRTAELLESGRYADGADKSPAARLVDLLLDSDRIDFIVGTKINDAHQDPSMPIELEIRRNVVKRIARLLEDRYLKETGIAYV